MARLLVVDDEFRIREIIKKYGEYEGHQVIEAADGAQALAICQKQKFDLIIMDIMMPEMDGLSAFLEIVKYQYTPVIFLSARGEEYDRIRGFEMGADDYVVKPFSPKELMMRVKAVLKRAGKETSDVREVFSVEGLVIDFTGRTVTVDGERADLSPKEYDLLFYMAKNRNIALSRERLITQVWGYDFYGNDRTLDTHIKMLRKNLGKYSSRIVTLRGVGYRFDG